jgi:hypothetical protein
MLSIITHAGKSSHCIDPKSWKRHPVEVERIDIHSLSGASYYADERDFRGCLGQELSLKFSRAITVRQMCVISAVKDIP